MSVGEDGTWAFTSGGSTVEFGAEAVFNPPSANIAGNVTATDYLFANGVPLMTAVDSMVSAANVNLKGYTDNLVSTANVNLKGYVDNLVSTANVNLKGYTDNLVSTANVNLKGYVDGQITNLVGGSPATLDTLNEIAAALGNDANLSVTLTNLITGVQGNVTAANAAIVTANTNLKGYTDNLVSTANVNLKGYVDGQISTTTSAITTANTNMKGYVDNGLSSLSSDKISASASNVTVTASFVNVAINSSNVASFSSTELSTTGNIRGNDIIATTGVFPATDNTGALGNAALTWSNGQFTNLTIDSTLNVRAAIDLADSDVLRLGSGDDWEFFHDGTGNYMDLNVGNLIIRDNTTTKITIERTTGNITTTGDLSATNLTGTLLTAAQTNITQVGTLTSGTWNATTIATNRGGTGLTSFTTNGALYATSTSALTTGTLPVASGGTGITSFGAGVATWLGTPSSANLLAAITDETGTGALVFGTSPTFTTQITTPSIVKSGTTGVGNIGQSNNSFNTVFAKATSAQYADLAEIYTSDKKYIPGTVVVFGGDKEVTVSTISHDPSVAGVVSTNPAYLMNDTVDGAAVALQGRVPCRVLGPVNKGDRVVSSDVRGVAERLDMTKYQPGCIIGKSLDYVPSGEIATIEVVVGRN
jgi:hypothetical protein